MEITNGSLEYVMGKLSYADGMRLINQSFLDSALENILIPRQEAIAIDRRRLFG